MSRKEFSEGKQSMMQISPLYPCNPRMCLSACLCLLFALILSVLSALFCPSILHFRKHKPSLYKSHGRCSVLVYTHDKTNLAPSSKDVGNFIRSGVLFVCVYVCGFVYLLVATVLVGWLVGWLGFGFCWLGAMDPNQSSRMVVKGRTTDLYS